MFQVKRERKDNIFVEFNALTENISPLTSLVEEFTEQYLSNSDAYNMSVAVDEAVTNIIMHGYKQCPDGVILIHLFKIEDEVCIQIENESERFVPPVIVEKKKFSFDKLEEGGLGLFLMQEFMDELRFLYDEEHSKNIILMKKYILS